MSMATGARNSNRTGMQKEKIPKGYQKGQLAQFTPEQMQLFQSMFGQLGSESFLGKLAGGDQSQFEQLEAPALRQFGELQGNIASRFSGGGFGTPGASSARKSSGFQNYLGAQTRDFASQLQSQRMELQRNAIKDLMGFSNDLLQQRPYENFLIKKQQKPSTWESLVGGALPVAGATIGGIFGGIPGATLGSTVGSSAARGFFG